MQQEIRFATFNVCNLAPPGMKYYERMEPYTRAEYDAKTTWLAQQLDRMDADVIGFQEIFSQAALKDVLAKTRHYREAHHAGFDPDPRAEKLTPSVALVSRLPLAGPAQALTDLPQALHTTLPGSGRAVVRFTRPVLHARVMLTNQLMAHVCVLHLKSKRPDYIQGEHEDDYRDHGIATLRSLVRRGTEALGVRLLLAELLHGNRVPAVVMGDFNDVASASTTQLLMGGGQHHRESYDERLFDAYRIQRRVWRGREVAFTDIHDGLHETIDHILVSEEFNPDSRFAIGAVEEVLYFNDHVAQDLPYASDHGQVLARLRLYE
ncbi:MAG: endonuclease/exonuclease/phosphatase family protein [Burkholderiaceae bacterium]|nr:endonuclease/exonuclease/phosphatase family protein [Burkholderiaceae bacterium]